MIKSYPMDIYRCFVSDGKETARFQSVENKASSKRLSVFLPPASASQRLWLEMDCKGKQKKLYSAYLSTVTVIFSGNPDIFANITDSADRFRC